MTKNEKIKKMLELKEEVENKVTEYNDLLTDGKASEVRALDEKISDMINEYTGLSRDVCFETLSENEDPMLSAIVAYSFPTIAVKDEKIGELKIPKRTVIEKEKPIDLLKLHKYVKGGIGHNKDWVYMIEKFNFLMTASVAVDLGINPKEINDSYAMSDIAKSYDLGKNPASKTNLLKTMTNIVQAMIGEEYKPISRDVNYLLRVYTKKGRKALSVTCANHNYMRSYMMDICNRIVTGGVYDVEYKIKRK